MIMRNALIKVCVLDGKYSSLNWEKGSIKIGYCNSFNSLFKEDILYGFSSNGDGNSICFCCSFHSFSSYSYCKDTCVSNVSSFK